MPGVVSPGHTDSDADIARGASNLRKVCASVATQKLRRSGSRYGRVYAKRPAGDWRNANTDARCLVFGA